MYICRHIYTDMSAYMLAYIYICIYIYVCEHECENTNKYMYISLKQNQQSVTLGY